MNAYTISKLASDAGVSVHIIRDYELRGLISPCECSQHGYRIYDKHTLLRLEFVLEGKAAGISLCDLEKLCHAIDNKNTEKLNDHLEQIHYIIEEKIKTQRTFKRQLHKIKLS